MRKLLSILTALVLCLVSLSAIGEAQPDGTPPAMPSGQQGGGPGGAPGGQSSQPESYTAVTTVSEDTTLTGNTYDSTGTDENAILVTGGTLNISNATLTRTSANNSGGDSASFYGVGAALLVTGGTADVTDCTVTTDAAGGAGIFA